MVSPGVLEPASYFQQVAASGKYLMPQYISSFIIASDINVLFPGLGTQQDTDDDDNISGVIHILMKYAYAPNLSGGFGPFTFAPADDTQTNPHNFRVERKSGGILLTVPGAQIIGYVTKVVPKFPQNQTGLPAPLPCTVQPVNSKSPTRKRRSVSEGMDISLNIKNLAQSLFTKSFERSSKNPSAATAFEFLTRKEYVSNEVLEKLLRESDETKDRIEKFMESLDVKENHPATVLPKVQDPGSVYFNDTLTVDSRR